MGKPNEIPCGHFDSLDDPNHDCSQWTDEEDDEEQE